MLTRYGTHFTKGLDQLLETYRPLASIDVAPTNVLDVGCGYAREIPLIRSALKHPIHFTCIDSNSSLILPAQFAHVNDTFYALGAQYILPMLPKECFDGLLLFHPEMVNPLWSELTVRASECLRRGGVVFSTHYARDEFEIMKNLLDINGFSFIHAEQNKHVVSQDFDAPHKYLVVATKIISL
jgi:SAM-dependent methyltransferase